MTTNQVMSDVREECRLGVYPIINAGFNQTVLDMLIISHIMGFIT